jgi:hypothetical protein
MIVKFTDLKDKIQKVRRGEIKEGLSLGVKEIDEYFRFKRGLNVILGHSNVGKTTTMFYMMLLYAVKHDLRWLIFSSENEAYSLVRKLVEFMEGLVIFQIEDSVLEERLKWINEHFKIISADELYSYKKLLAEAEKIKDAWNYDGLLIDPYNSLTKDKELLRGLSTHDYDYQAASEMRIFCSKNNAAIWLNTHAATDALRKLHPKEHEFAGHPIPPMSADVEGGGKFVNRADDFMVIHRYTQHPTDWMYSEIHIRKIKDTDTGGRPTSLDSPIRLRSLPDNVGFAIDGKNILHQLNSPIIK